MERVLCPHCHAKIKHDGNRAGQVVSCPRCRGQIQLPALAAAPAPVEASPFEFDGHLAAAPRLIACKACGNQIGTHAVSCPRCGQLNDWVHPEIQRFIDNIDRVQLPANYRYFANRDRLEIEARPASGAARWGLLGVAFLLIGGAGGAAAALVLPAQATVWVLGLFLFLAPAGCFAVAFVKGLSGGGVTRCTVDFSEMPPRFSSDSETAWRGVKRFFGP